MRPVTLPSCAPTSCSGTVVAAKNTRSEARRSMLIVIENSLRTAVTLLPRLAFRHPAQAIEDASIYSFPLVRERETTARTSRKNPVERFHTRRGIGLLQSHRS